MVQAEGEARAIREKALAQSNAIMEIADALSKGGYTDRAAQLNIAREVLGVLRLVCDPLP
jgi:uncharacterized membrane protein YqiK